MRDTSVTRRDKPFAGLSAREDRYTLTAMTRQSTKRSPLHLAIRPLGSLGNRGCPPVAKQQSPPRRDQSRSIGTGDGIRRLAREELEERVAPSLGDVVLKAFIDPEPVAVEDGRRRPDGRAEKDSEHTPTTEPGELVLHEPAGLGRFELGRVHRLRAVASTDDRLARCSKVPDPIDLAERRLDEPPVTELPHCDPCTD